MERVGFVMQQKGLLCLKVLGQVAILYLLSECGNWIMTLLHIKFPGSIVGLIILLILLITKIIPENWIANGADTLLTNMTLFFIPVTVGIVDYPELISWQGLLIFGVIFVTTILSIVISGKATQAVEKYLEKPSENQLEPIVETALERIQQKGEA
jgi:holin-like protein